MLAAGHARVGRLGATAGWRCVELAPGGLGDLVDRPGRDAGAVAVRLVRGDLRRRDVRRARAAPTCSAGRATSSTCRATPSVDGHQRRAAAGSRCRRRVCERRLPFRHQPADARAGRAARRRRGEPPGQQLLHARGVRGRRADRLRGAHPGRQLVVVPAAQARRGDRRPRACSRRSTTSRSPTARPARASATSGCTATRTARSTCWPRCAAATSC